VKNKVRCAGVAGARQLLLTSAIVPRYRNRSLPGFDVAKWYLEKASGDSSYLTATTVDERQQYLLTRARLKL
jgi:hypothetical protein